MSEILGKALLYLGVDKSALAKGLADAKTETGAAVGGMGGLFNSLSLTAAASFTGIVLAVKKVADAYGEQEAAEIRFQTALRKTGQFSEETKQEFLDFAGVMQNLTTLDDSLIVSLGGLLLNLGVLPADLQRATKAGADLAAALDIDLRAAMMLVGRAAAGNIELFARYGVTFDKAKAEAGGFNYILAELERRFGGQAQANNEGYSRSLQAIANSFGDLLEQIGKPFAQTFAQGKSPVVNILDSMREGLAGIESIFRRAGESFGRFVVELLKLPPATEAVRKSFDAGLKGLEERTESLIDQQEELTEAVIKRYTEMAEATIKSQEEAAKEEAEIASKLAEEKSQEERKLTEAIIRMHVETAEAIIRIQEEEAEEEARIASALLEEKEKNKREFIASEVKRAEEIVKRQEEAAEREAKIAIKLAEDREKADRSWVKGVKEGYDELEKRSKDYAGMSKGFILDAYNAAERSLSDGFFTAMTGKFKDLEDVVDDFGKAIVRAFADMSAKMVASTAWQFLTGQGAAGGGGGLGGILGGLGSLFSGLLGGGGSPGSGGGSSAGASSSAGLIGGLASLFTGGWGGALIAGGAGILGGLGLSKLFGGKDDPYKGTNMSGAITGQIQQAAAQLLIAKGIAPDQARLNQITNEYFAWAGSDNMDRFGAFMGSGRLNDLLRAKFPGFKRGGYFDVGGIGGPDSQLVALLASPGERVTVEPPGSEAGGGADRGVSIEKIEVHMHGADLGTPSGRREAARLLVREMNAELLDLNRRTVGATA